VIVGGGSRSLKLEVPTAVLAALPGAHVIDGLAKAVPEAYLLGDRKVYEKSFEGVRGTISPDGQMPAGAMENALKFLADGDPKIAADLDKIKLADTWTNEFAQRAGKRS